jgi:WD40 repeat protein
MELCACGCICPTTRRIKAYQFLQNDIQNISFSPDRKTIATVGNNSTTIRLFDSSGSNYQKFQLLQASHKYHFSPNSKLLRLVMRMGTVSFFNQNGKELEPIKTHKKTLRVLFLVLMVNVLAL